MPPAPEAFILAGGRSSRMGQDKALLHYEGQLLIQHAIAKFLSLGLRPRIAGNRPDLATFAPVIADRRPACGPLGGIEAALSASHTNLNIFLPVDLPLLPPIFLQWMLTRANLTGATATIPQLQGRPQPLCCVLRPTLLPQISHALDNGNFKVMNALTSSPDTDLFNIETLATAQRVYPAKRPLHQWFQNLNTPADLYAFPTAGTR